jgi:hypothetical protein
LNIVTRFVCFSYPWFFLPDAQIYLRDFRILATGRSGILLFLLTSDLLPTNVGLLTLGQLRLLDSQRPLLDGQRPLLDGQRPLLDGQRPLLDGQRPFLDGQRSFPDRQPSFLDRQRPLLGRGRPLLDRGRPLLDRERSFLDRQRSLLTACCALKVICALHLQKKKPLFPEGCLICDHRSLNAAPRDVLDQDTRSA